MSIVSVLCNIISPSCFRDISCIFPDGTINEERVKFFAKKFHSFGADHMRIFPWLGIGTKSFPNEEKKNLNYFPWEYEAQSGKFNLENQNDLWFENFTKICEIMNRNGITVILSILDRCHMVSKRVPWTPFQMNNNKIEGIYSLAARVVIEKYLKRILGIVKSKKYRVKYELINEPNVENEKLIPVTKLLLKILRENNIEDKKILSGKQRFRAIDGKISDNNYGEWRRKTGKFNDNIRENGGYCVIHGFPDWLWEKGIVGMVRHTRRGFFSSDGSRTTKAWWGENLSRWLNTGRKNNFGEEFGYEAIYSGKIKESQTHIDEVQGICEAFRTHYGYWPTHAPYDISIIDPGIDPPIEPEPEPKSITILSPNSYDKISVDANNRNLTIGITWKFTGDIEFVDIQYRSDGFLWAFISERELNDSAYKWESANLKNGKNWIRISDSHGETQATQEFEVEFIYQEEKKMTIKQRIEKVWAFLKRWWRWGLAGIVIPASIAAVFINPWYQPLVIAVNYGLVKFKIFKL